MKHTCPEHGRNRPRTGSDQPLCPCGSMNGVYHEDDCPKKRGETMPSDRLEKKPEADVALAGAALEKAIALAEEGWSYASEYFREKWGCVEELKALRRIASVTDDEPLPTSWAEEVLERAAPCASVGESNAGKVGRPDGDGVRVDRDDRGGDCIDVDAVKVWPCVDRDACRARQATPMPGNAERIEHGIHVRCSSCSTPCRRVSAWEKSLEPLHVAHQLPCKATDGAVCSCGASTRWHGDPWNGRRDGEAEARLVSGAGLSSCATCKGRGYLHVDDGFGARDRCPDCTAKSAPLPSTYEEAFDAGENCPHCLDAAAKALFLELQATREEVRGSDGFAVGTIVRDRTGDPKLFGPPGKVVETRLVREVRVDFGSRRIEWRRAAHVAAGQFTRKAGGT